MADAPALEYPCAMFEGSKLLESYSGRMRPALGLRRLTSAMTDMLGMVGWPSLSLEWSTTAAKKSRGASVPAAWETKSESETADCSAATCSRLDSMISLRTAGTCSGGWVMWVILGVVLMGVVGSAGAQTVDTTEVQDMSVSDLVQTMEQWKLILLSVSMLLVIALLFAGGLLRPGGFAKAGLRDVGSLPSVVWLFAIFVVLLAMSSAPQLIGKIGWIEQQGYDATQMKAIHTVGIYAFGMIAGVGMLLMLKWSCTGGGGKGEKGEGKCESGLGLSFLDVPVGLGCFVLAYPFIELMNMLGVWVYTATQGADPHGIGHGTLQLLVDEPENYWVWAIVAGAVIGAPFVEELIYRVFLQGALIKWLKSPWLAIIFSSLIFAATHRPWSEDGVPWHAILPIFAVGLTCGIAYERTKRVGVPIVMHMCFNGLNVMLALMIGAGASQTGV